MMIIGQHRVGANISPRNLQGVSVYIHATHVACTQYLGSRREHACAASKIQHCSTLDVVELVVR
jgi:hypothetical protein